MAGDLERFSTVKNVSLVNGGTARSLALPLSLMACAAASPPLASSAARIDRPMPSNPAAPSSLASSSAEDEGLLPILSTDPSWGDRLSPVTLVRFGTYLDFSRYGYMTMLLEVRDSYPANALRIVWKDAAPVDPPAPEPPLSDGLEEIRAAAIAARTVMLLSGTDDFLKFSMAAAREREIQRDAPFFDARVFEGIAQQMSDVSRYRALIVTRQPATLVDAGGVLLERLWPAHEGMRTFVNGTPLLGNTLEETLRRVIDAEMVKATTALKAGVASNRIHATLVTANLRAAALPPEDVQDTSTIHAVPIGRSPVRGNAQRR